MIREFLWRGLAWVACRPAVRDWLIRRALGTPYTHIHGREDGKLYMGRWWLFNPYPTGSDGTGRRWGDWLPSVRVHLITHPDTDRHLHDHPWNARTIILRGWYLEELTGSAPYRLRSRGDTGRLLFGQFHRIQAVGYGGAWTLFITWRKRGTWGFLVNGRKVAWREHLNIEQ